MMMMIIIIIIITIILNIHINNIRLGRRQRQKGRHAPQARAPALGRDETV